MRVFRVSAADRVRAPAAHIYRLIADYREGHPRIVPPQYFRNLTVEEGGYGAGTHISLDMTMLGSSKRLRAVVEEPDPGRVLIERYPEDGTVTTFVVEPLDAATSHVTIATEIPWKAGITGAIERFIAARMLPKIYRAELARIDQIASREMSQPTQAPRN